MSDTDQSDEVVPPQVVVEGKTILEILEQLEVARRGVYTGAIGWFGPGEQMHLNIAIRTLVHRGGRVRGNAGGGITSLSDPHAEWRETLAKMAGLEVKEAAE